MIIKNARDLSRGDLVVRGDHLRPYLVISVSKEEKRFINDFPGPGVFSFVQVKYILGNKKGSVSMNAIKKLQVISSEQEVNNE